MCFAIALLAVAGLGAPAIAGVPQPPAGATLENPEKRSITAARFGIDAAGDRIVAMLGGSAEDALSLIDLNAHQITTYRIALARVRVTRVAISGDGETLYAGGSVRTQFPASGAWYDRSIMATVDVRSGRVHVLSSHADTYGYDIAPSPDGRYLFYFRSSHDAPPQPGEMRATTKYTHGFSAFTSDKLLARYDLVEDQEALVGPIAVPHGNSVVGLQVTAHSLYFYADGISRAMAYDFDPSWSFLEAMRQADARQDTYSRLYQQTHPTDIEAIDPSDTRSFALFHYRLPAGTIDLAPGAKVATVRPEDFGITSQLTFVRGEAKPPRTAAYPSFMQSLAGSGNPVRPEISDDENVVAFLDTAVSCWGRRAPGQALTCVDYDHRDIQRDKRLISGSAHLSRDGKKLVFLSQGTISAGGANDNTWRVCSLIWPNSLDGCEWLGAERFASRDVAALPDADMPATTGRASDVPPSH